MAKSNFIIRGGLQTSEITKGLAQTQKQLGAFQNKVSKSLGFIKTAFAGIAIGTLVKDSLTAAGEMQSAMTGLTSIVQGQGRDINVAKKFLNDYVADGLIPMTDAVTTYKNLVSRGYNDEQIQNTMTRLKDAASFGRQSSLSLGEAVKSASEGLKNENSILVDNAGVTKNVAKMWQDYAKSIGKSVTDLSQQEKIQAEVNGIMQETKFQVGDAAKYADTYQGRISALSKTLNDIKVNLGNAFMPIANVVLPILQNFGDKIASITKALSEFSQALFGKALTTTAEKNASNTSTAITNIGEAAEKAGKKAKKALAPFDELINMSSEASTSATTATSGTKTSASKTTANEARKTAGIKQDASAGGISTFADAAEKLKKKLEPLTDALSNLWEAIRPLSASIGKGFIDFAKDCLKIGEDALDGWIPSGINKIAEALGKINPSSGEKIGSGLGTIGIALLLFKGATMVSKFLGGLPGLFSGIATSMSTFLISLNPLAFVATFSEFFEGVDEALWDMSPQWAKDIWTAIWDPIYKIVEGTFHWERTASIINDIKESFNKAVKSGKWYEIGGAIIKGVLEGLLVPLSFVLEPILNFFTTLVDAFCDTFGIHSPAAEMKPIGGNIILGVIEGIKNGWTNGWNTFKTWLSKIPSIIGGAMGDFFSVGKGMMDKLVSGIKSVFIPDVKVPVYYGGTTSLGTTHSSGGGKFGASSVVGNAASATNVLKYDNSEEISLMKTQNTLLRNILNKTGITTKEIFDATAKENDKYIKRTGRSRLMAY